MVGDGLGDAAGGAANAMQSASAAAADDGGVDGAAVGAIASQLLGDPLLQLSAARYSGACAALGLATLSPANALSAVLTSAVVLSTGEARDAVADSNGAKQASTAFGVPAGRGSGFPPGSYDATVLEIDVQVAASAPKDSQISMTYIFGSDEFAGGGGSRRPDPFVSHIRPAGSGAAASVALLPGGGSLTGAGARPPARVEFYENEPEAGGGSPMATALDGFTQVGGSGSAGSLLGGARGM